MNLHLIVRVFMAAIVVALGASRLNAAAVTNTGVVMKTDAVTMVTNGSIFYWCYNIPMVYCLSDTCPQTICLVDNGQQAGSASTAQNVSVALASVVDETSLAYIHDALDVSILSAASGCSSCGGSSAGASDGLLPAFLKRSHRYRDMLAMGAFGPGVFCNYNIQLKIAKLESGAWQVIVFDPGLSASLILADNGSGVFTGAVATAIRGLTFYTGAGGGGSATADPSLALSAVLTTFKGNTFSFDVINTYPSNLPSPWTQGDIGSGLLHGKSTYASGTGTFSLSGGGIDIWGTADAQTYVYQAMTGDLTITARVASIATYRGLAAPSSDTWAKAGVMIREGLDADAKAVNCFITPGAGVNYQSRMTSGASMVWDATASASAPEWVQLARVGNVITGSISSDGVTWTTLTTKTVAMNTVVYVGLSLTAHDSAVLTDADFDNVSLSGTAVTPTSSWPAPTTAPYTSPNLSGRLAQIADRNGYGVTIAYPTLTSTQLTTSPDLQWEMSSATDSHGRVIGFTYGSSQVSGRWAVSQVTMPNSATIDYTYTSGLLSGISYPDGTSSTFTYTPDATTNCTIVAIDDAGATGTHRRKEAYLSNLFNLDYTSETTYQVYDQSSNLIRLLIYPGAGVSGQDEVAYLSLSVDYVDALHYEGPGKLKLISKGGSSVAARYYSTWSVDTSTDVVTGTLETNYPTYISANYESYRLGIATSSVDAQGVAKTYTNDSDGYPTVVTYSDSTTEEFTYDGFKQIKRHKDRLGRVTINSYNTTTGNLEKVEVGIAVVMGTDTHQSGEYAHFDKSYHASGADQGLLDTATDALGHVTSYTYATGTGQAHLVSVVTTPADVGSGTIAGSTLAYDSYGRLHTSTDAVGRITTFDYDNRDRLTTTTYSDASTEIERYGTGADANLLVAHKDRQGTLTEYGYDNAGRLISTTTGLKTMSADGSTTTSISSTLVNTESLKSQILTTYLPGTALVATRSVNGNLTTTAYDYRQRMVGRTIYPTASGGLTSAWIYENNFLAQTTDPYGRSTYMNYRASDARMTRMVQGLIPSDGVGNATTAGSISRSGTTTNPPYLMTEYNLDAEGQQIGVTDPRGIIAATHYDSRGRVTDRYEDTATLNAQTTYVYDLQSNQTEIRMPRYYDSGDSNGYGKATITMDYTQRNLLKTRTAAPSASGVTGVQSFTYYDDGRAHVRTDENSHDWITTWGACCGRIQGQLDPLVSLPGGSGSTNPGRVTRHNDYGDLTHEGVVSDYTTTTFPALPTPTNSTDLDDASTVNEVTTAYDVRHRPIARTVWLSAHGTVDANNPPIAGWGGISSSAGLTTFYRYDDDLTDSLGLSNTSDPYSVHSYLSGLGLGTNAVGRAMVAINPAGEPTWTIYDGLGRVVRVVDGNGNAVTTTYDAIDSGLVKTVVTDALSHATAQFADAAGRVRVSRDALAKDTAYGYDGNGNVVSTRDPNSVGQDCVFDGRNRRTNCTDTHSDATAWTYDADNNVATMVDGLSQTNSFIYDARERKTTTTDRVGGVTAFAYDPVSNLLTITDADTHAAIITAGITTYTYDVRNLLLTETFPPGQATPGSPGTPPIDRRTYAYDAAHRLVSRLDQEALTTGYGYDFANRLTGRTYSDGAGDDSFTYDTASRLLTAVSGRYVTTVARDYTTGGEKAGRLVAETQTVGGVPETIAYGYDAANRQTLVTYPDGTPVNRDFTDRNQLKSVGRTSSNTTNIASLLSYDDGMRRTSLALGNGLTEYRTYRTDNLVSTITESGVTDYTYSYDADKNVTAETVGTLTAETEHYGYDQENRVTSWDRNTSTETQVWTLSPVGDWQSTAKTGPNAYAQTRAPTDVHEILSITPSGGSPLGLTYDAKGNLTNDPTINQAYAWDPENRLINSVTATGETSYGYDALGRRLSKTGTAPTDHLIANLHLDEGTGTSTADAAGGDNTGTITGSTWVPGINGHGLHFNGTSDAVIVAPTGLPANNASQSISWWYRQASVPSAPQAMMSIGDFSTSAIQPGFRDNGTGMRIGVWKWGGPWLVSATIPTTGLWHHCCYSFDGTTHRFYLDGVLADSSTVAAQTATPTGAVLAYTPTVGEYFAGDLDEVRIYDRTLTATEAASIANATVFVHDEAQVVAEYAPFNTASAPTRSYVYGSYVDEPLALITGGNTYFYADNRVYSVAALTNSSGTVVERYRYDAYGIRAVLNAAGTSVVSTGTAYGNQRGFTGYYLDAESGLNYAVSRIYSPVLGRFIERDKLGYLEGYGLYEAYFVPDDVDPSGAMCCQPKSGGPSYEYSNTGNNGHCPSDADPCCSISNPPATNPPTTTTPSSTCRITVNVWYLRETLGIARHGYVQTNCNGTIHTYELEDDHFEDPDLGKGKPNKYPNKNLPNPYPLPDENGKPSMLVVDFSLPDSTFKGGKVGPQGRERSSGEPIETQISYDNTFTDCTKCDCIATKSAAYAKDPTRPVHKGEYHLLGANSNSYLVSIMKDCVDPGFSLGWGGIGGGLPFRNAPPPAPPQFGKRRQ